MTLSRDTAAARDDGARAAADLPSGTLRVFALTSGLSVAGMYCAQPLIEPITRAMQMPAAFGGALVTATQVGYALGLVLLVPLADALDRRRLILAQLLLSVPALLAVASARSAPLLMAGLALVGLLAVIVQMLVALAAALSAPAHQGRAVGAVTSGVVLGIIAARTLAGPLAERIGWRGVYVALAALSLLMAAAMWRVLPRHGARVRVRAWASYADLLRSLLALFAQERVLRVRAGLALLLFAGFGVLWSSLALTLSAPPLSLSPGAIGLFGLAGFAGTVGAARAGALADRGRAQWAIGGALVLMLAAWWPLSRHEAPLWSLAIGVAVLELAGQALHVTNQSLLFRARPNARNRLVAGYMVFYSIGTGLGAIASTAVFAWAGWRGACQLGAAISAAALLFWVLTLEHGPPRHSVDPPSSDRR